MLRIVEEDLSTCVEAKSRFYVIDTPINETGVCAQFETREEAEAYKAEAEKAKKETARSGPVKK